MTEIREHIGKRIRLYRKNKKYTQEEFARLIHKSKSAVSKYECGEVAIDIDTLYDIAEVLEISIHQLMDYPVKTEPVIPGLQGYFSKANRFYTYYLNKNSSRIVRGLLEINYIEECKYTTVLFADLKQYENPYNCCHLYYGDIHYSDSYINMVMNNQANPAERIFLIIANPYNINANLTVGIISGISSRYLVPISLKVILSKTRLEETEELRNTLRLNKEDYERMRKTYCFSVDRLIDF